MKKIIFEGCGTALVTPFIGKEVNFDELEKLIDFQIMGGVDAIIVCGTTGESATMSEDERKKVIKFAVDTVAHRVPVIAGTGSNNTNDAIKLSKYAESVGVDGILVVTPYYNKTTQNGLVQHYKAISNEVHIPIILYNVPSRTGVNIEPKTCLELSKIENIVAIKEASGNISQIAEIANLCGNNLNIYSGNDNQIVPILSIGGIGVISVMSNILPKEVHDIVYSYFNNDVQKSYKMQLKAIPLINSLFAEVNPIPIKEALNMIGFDVGIPRLPLVKISDTIKEKLRIEMEKYELL